MTYFGLFKSLISELYYTVTTPRIWGILYAVRSENVTVNNIECLPYVVHAQTFSVHHIYDSIYMMYTQQMLAAYRGYSIRGAHSQCAAQPQGQVAYVVSCRVSSKSGLDFREGKGVMAGHAGPSTR